MNYTKTREENKTMNETSTTMNNTTTRTTLRHILRALVCMVLLAVCVPGVGENVAAATKVKVGDITEKGEVILTASKKKGEVYTDKGFPVKVDNYSSKELPDDAFCVSTETGGTLTLEYSMTCKKDIDYPVSVKVVSVDDLIAELLFEDSGSRETGYSNSASITLSPGKYIISSYFMNNVKASLNVYFNAYQIGITIPETMEMQKGDDISLNDVLTTDPIELLSDYKSVATWISSDESVATVGEDGTVIAVGAGIADITITLPGDATATCTITVTESVENAIDIVPTSIKLSKTSYIYDEKTKKPKVTVLDQNGNAIPSSMIVLKTYYNNTNFGTAKVFVAVTGGTQVQEDGTTYAYHAATFVKKFKIKAGTAKKVTVKKKTITYKNTFEYTDETLVNHIKGQKQKVTVYDSKGKKISAEHYTVAYSDGAIHAGNVKVTVKMDKCYGKKKLTTSYTIKVNSMTAKLFPNRTYFKYSGDGQVDLGWWNGTVSSSFSYVKQSKEVMKKLLPYGDLDVEEDIVDYIWAYYNRNIFREDKKQAEQWGTGDALKFTGTIGDLIQCCIPSKITKVEGYNNKGGAEVTCENGKTYFVTYHTGGLGLKSGYVQVEIDTGELDPVYAYIKP